ncbi:MAG: T9SS type A sorting domain-containing protein [Chitinophagales bacterium]|nr:T9SS type A sorting domain-containing protein [Chitinophagales bacterium]
MQYRVSGTNTWTKTSATNNYKKLKTLLSNTQYDWQVKSVCIDLGLGNSTWSAIQNFTTLPAKLVDKETASSFEVYPNPFSISTTILFSLRESSTVTIELFDLAGRKLRTVDVEDLSEGNHKINFNKESIAAGIYFLQFKTQTETITKKLGVE